VRNERDATREGLIHHHPDGCLVHRCKANGGALEPPVESSTLCSPNAVPLIISVWSIPIGARRFGVERRIHPRYVASFRRPPCTTCPARSRCSSGVSASQCQGPMPRTVCTESPRARLGATLTGRYRDQRGLHHYRATRRHPTTIRIRVHLPSRLPGAGLVVVEDARGATNQNAPAAISTDPGPGHSDAQKAPSTNLTRTPARSADSVGPIIACCGHNLLISRILMEREILG
jgi:hypothetical protein